MADRRITPRPPRPKGESLVGSEFELEIERVATGGSCVGRHEGRVVFVRHTLPGERVVARVTDGRSEDRFLRADAVEVLRASEHRVERPCPYSGPAKCGGCDWQHVDLAAQRRLKADVVAEQLRRLAGIDRDVVVEAVVADGEADDGLNWRTRMQFAVSAEGRLGLRKARSHDLELLQGAGPCRIAARDIDALEPYDAVWTGGSEIEVAVSPGADARVIVASGPGRLRVPPLAADAGVLLRRPEPAPASRHGEHTAGARGGDLERVRGRTWLPMPAAGRTWRVSAGAFWQVHPAAADALADAVLAGLNPAPGEVAIDLYAGVGLFAGVLAERVAGGRVYAVESDKRAVSDARRNLHESPAVTIVAEKVDRALTREGLLPERAALVVLDPPRSGAGAEVVHAIAARRPRRIAYVACDPAALARDLATFAEAGYALADLRAFDLFPMTQHVECVAILSPEG